MSRLSPGDLVDLEARLLDEHLETEEVRQTRYRQLGLRLAEKGPLPDDNGDLLKALLRLDPRADAAGRRFDSALAILHALLAVAGLVLGGSLTLGLLSNDGKHPVNILTAVGVLVGVQLVILVLLVIALFPTGDPRASGPVQHLLLALLAKLGVGDRVAAVQDRLDAHRGLLKWLLIRATQVFGVAFNVAVIAVAFIRFSTTDIHFAWSSTIGVRPETVHRVADLVATPWSWMADGMKPKLTMVEFTEYDHLKGRYVREPGGLSDPMFPTLFAWWSFLIWAVMVYGFVPRLVVLALASIRVRYTLADTPRNNLELGRLCEWMRSPVVRTRPEGPDPAPHVVAAAPAEAEPDLPPPGTSVELLDGAPPEAAQILGARYGWTIGTGGPLVAVVSAWEEPTKGQLRRFKDLDRLVIVGLIDTLGTNDPRRDKIRARWKRELPKVARRSRVEAL